MIRFLLDLLMNSDVTLPFSWTEYVHKIGGHLVNPPLRPYFHTPLNR